MSKGMLFIASLMLFSLVLDASGESFLWGDLKAVQSGSLNLVIPKSFNTCNISNTGLDSCSFYFVVNNSNIDFTSQQLRGISINNVWDNPASVSGIKYSFTKNFTVKTAYKTTLQPKSNCSINNITHVRDCNTTYVNATRNWTVLDAGAYETGVSTWKKGESVFVKVDFQRTRLKELWFNLSFDIAGIHLFADPVVSVCGTLTYTASGGLPFTLGADITTSATCLIVASNNITIDGMGRYIDGSGDYYANGIEVSNQNNVTIRNITIKNFGGAAIYFESSTNSMVRNVDVGQYSATMGYLYAYGVGLFSNNNITVRDSYIHDLGGSDENYGYGISSFYTDDSLYTNNRLEDIDANTCDYTCYFSGIYDTGQRNNITNNNLTNVNYDAGIFIAYSTDSLVYGNRLESCEEGIHNEGAASSLIKNNYINSSSTGIRSTASAGNNRIEENNVSFFSFYGLFFYDDTYTNASRNKITNGTCDYGKGIILVGSSNLFIDANNMSDNCFNFGLSEEHGNFRNTVLPTNLVQGKKLYYNHSISNYEYNPTTAPDAGIVYALNSTNITVKGLDLSGRSEYGGAVFFGTNNSWIESNNLSWGLYGVYFNSKTVNNTAIGNNITLNPLISQFTTGYGFYSTGKNHSAISNNVTTTLEVKFGIYYVCSPTSKCLNVVIENNSVYTYGASSTGISVGDIDGGIIRGNFINVSGSLSPAIMIKENSANFTIDNNTINSYSTGIQINGGISYKSFYNNITNNYVYSRQSISSAIYAYSHSNFTRVVNNTLIGTTALNFIAPIIVYVESNSIAGAVKLSVSGGKGQSNYTFVNTSVSTVVWGSNENGNLTVFWYARVKTQSPTGTPIYSFVNVSNNTNASIFNGLTSTGGLTQWLLVFDSVYNRTRQLKTDNNYLIYASNATNGTGFTLNSWNSTINNISSTKTITLVLTSLSTTSAYISDTYKNSSYLNSIMLEIVLALGIAALIWAYLYTNVPTQSGWLTTALKMLFFGMALWTVYTMVFTAGQPNGNMTEYRYDSSGALSSVSVVNSTASLQSQSGVLSYIGASNQVYLFVFFMLIVGFVVLVLQGLATVWKNKG